MIHHSFSDFSSIVVSVLPELPGCIDEIISSHACTVFADFCEKTQAFIEEVEFSVSPGLDRYDFVSPHEGHIVVGIKSLTVDGSKLEPGDYVQHSPSVIELAESVTAESKAKALIILKPRPGCTSVPDSILDRWPDCIAAGVKARLMAMPGNDWSNPQLSGYYASEYKTMWMAAAADVRNEFGVSRKGRAGFTRSVWEV